MGEQPCGQSHTFVMEPQWKQSQHKGTGLAHYCSSAMPGPAVLHLPHALVTQLTLAHVIMTTSITVSENVSRSGQCLTLEGGSGLIHEK